MSSFSGSVLEGMVVLFLTGVKNFSELKSIENGCGTHPASSGYGGLSLEMWWLGVLDDHTPSSSIELRMTALLLFPICICGMFRDNFGSLCMWTFLMSCVGHVL